MQSHIRKNLADKFRRSVVEDNMPDLFDQVLDFVREQVEPDDVYDNDTLREWTEKNYPSPDDVYDEDALEKWATENGFTKQED